MTAAPPETGGAAGAHRRTVDIRVYATFQKAAHPRDFPPWIARKGKSRIVDSHLGSHPRPLPHDIVILVIERELGLTDGFFGTVEAGGTFRSMRKRRHAAGKAAIAANRFGEVEFVGDAVGTLASARGDDRPYAGIPKRIVQVGQPILVAPSEVVAVGVVGMRSDLDDEAPAAEISEPRSTNCRSGLLDGETKRTRSPA